ncbi:MAG: 4'-phosphopantetheinyl transferase family protein [Terriglobales bacterium]
MTGAAVYWFTLSASDQQRRTWWAWLSGQERTRAHRYLNPAHGERYMAAHAHLRWLLALELGCDPAELKFWRGAHGKPELAGCGPRFNLSHSGMLGLVGLHPSIELGVDVEAERARNFSGLAQHFFTPGEQAWLARQQDTAHAFARLWTCKEAWMKADGRGLAVLRQPEVQLAEGGATVHAAGRSWWTRELALASGYAAAVVMEAAPAGVSVAKLSPPPA